jgi:hypothetical protein
MYATIQNLAGETRDEPDGGAENIVLERVEASVAW